MCESGPHRAYTEAAQRALRSFPVDPGPISFVHMSENITYRVAAGEGQPGYVLRLHRPGYHGIDALRSERVWLRALKAAGCPVPDPISTRTGEEFSCVDIAELGESRWAGLSRWVEGDLLADVIKRSPADVRASCFRQLGGLIASFHNQAAGWTVPADFQRHAFDEIGLMGERPFWGPFWDHPILSSEEKRLLLRTRDAIRSALERYGKSPRTFSVIHADLHPRNVVLTQKGEFCAIDFDDASFGWHQYDLAVALLSYDQEPGFATVRDALIEGYRAVRAISDADLALIPMFTLARRLAQIGWALGRPEINVGASLEQTKRIAIAISAEFQPPC